MAKLYPNAVAFRIRDTFLREFVRQLERDINKTENWVEDQLTFGATRALSILSRATPNDSGHLNFNWQAGIGESPSGELDGVDQIGDVMLAREAPKLRAAYSGDVLLKVVLGNDTPYGGFVNNGTERQPPRLFVEAARDEAASENLFPSEDFKP